MKQLLLLLCLGMAFPAVSSDAVELLHRSTIDDVGRYIHLSPIVTGDGSYEGFVATDADVDRVDVYDDQGHLLDSILLSRNAVQSLARLSENRDTLVVYVLQDTTGEDWSGGGVVGFRLPRITVVTLAGDLIDRTTVNPNLVDTYNPYNSTKHAEATCGLEFSFDENFHPTGVVLRVNLTVSESELTMGSRTSKGQRYLRYDLALATEVIRESVGNFVIGNFSDEVGSGFATTANWYASVNDDPWNSGTSQGTIIEVGATDSTHIVDHHSGGASDYLFSGDFSESADLDEIIYAGFATDLTGVDSVLDKYWACYGFDDTVLNEIWRIPRPNGFRPHHYLPGLNAIVGVVVRQSIYTLDCATGAYVEEVALPHPLYSAAFLPGSSQPLPDIFGRLADTIFVYGLSTPTDVHDDPHAELPSSYSLQQNYPNPFNPTTSISFKLPQAADVSLKVYNVLGQWVQTLVSGELPAGTHSVQWNGTASTGVPVSSGVYLYRLQAGEYSATRKMLLLK
ncbi:T9SS type A sorting domain-containing protein [candidate division GN15 bacterium]|nr:T9SS type A sorting domain-containing protein [candidate division GN15 bacterium]